ncbi:MAG TPA: hypothetical protein VMY16_11580 [Ilumatobacteraceae bacterium]|nr:hypothetical protein [Ilumatobacteraceae bacterium]
MPRRRSLAALLAVAAVAAGCGVTDGGADETIPPVTPVPTVAGVGVVPAVPSAVREPVIVVRPPVDEDGTEAELIGDRVEGNRVLMIGDSILASTASRYGNHMCEAVVPLGWQVAVEAEPSRFVEFGNRVLDKLLVDDADPDDDWNTAVVFLGSNYRGDAEAFEAELVEILDRLAPRPVVLLTVTEYRPNYVEVNEVVNRLGAEHENITVLDWRSISDTPGVLSSDGLHPTDTGRRVLAESVAAALGPAVGEGDCLRSTFRDDSRVGGDSATVLGRPSRRSSSSGSSATATTRPPTSNTTTSIATGSGGDETPETTTPSAGVTTSAPVTTGAPVTTAPTTAPPTTTTPPERLAEPTP